jgi:hypothetical protein
LADVFYYSVPRVGFKARFRLSGKNNVGVYVYELRNTRTSSQQHSDTQQCVWILVIPEISKITHNYLQLNSGADVNVRIRKSDTKYNT